MSKHSHHSCECTHTDVKFCKTCKIVHCLDCNQEWGPKITYTYTYGYTPWYNTTGYLKNLSGAGGSNGISSAQAKNWDTILDNKTEQPIPLANETICDHKA